MKSIQLVILSLSLGLLGCLPEKVVEIEIPPHERQLVVECYLEPGKPFRLMLTESVGFFDAPDTPFVDGALVVVSHGGIHDTLSNVPAFDFQDLKFYNYSSSSIVPADYDSDFTLFVRDRLGRELRGTTKLLRPIEFSDLFHTFNEDTMAAVTAQWLDEPGVKNYYRFTLHKDSLVVSEESKKGLRIEFTLDDRIGDGQEFTVSTFFDFKPGASLICTVYRLTEEAWRYFETASLSADANGNPFANPVTIYSTVEGGFGVFTGLNYFRDTLEIP